MKKHFTLVLMLTAFFFTAQAQKGDLRLGVGVDVAMPLGDFSEGYGIGLGGSVKGLYGLNDDADITFTTGYLRFGMKDMPEDVSGSIGFIPLLAGYRHQFGGLYVEPQVGLTVTKSNFKISGLEAFGISGSGTASSADLGYAIGGGYLIDKLDLGIRFQGVSASGGSFNLIGFRAAYNFSL